MLTNEFISLCKDYAEKCSHVLAQEAEDSKKVCKYKIFFHSHCVEFRYVKKESLYFKPSSLYCVIYLNKNSVVYYHLTDLIPYLECPSFQPCYFCCIESPERLNSCFDHLVDTLEHITSQLSSCLSKETALSEALFSSYQTIYALKETDLDFSKIEKPEEYEQSYFLSLQAMRDGYLFSRFSNFAPYALLLKNKPAKALKKYKQLDQKGKLLEYEKHLMNHIAASRKHALFVFDSPCVSSINAEKLLSPLSAVKSFLIVFAITSVLFCSCFALYNFIISANALIVLSVPWYMGFICAGFCSVFGGIALLSHMPIPSKSLSKEQQKDLLKILVPKGVKKLTLITFALSLAFSIFLAVMMLIPNVRFYDEQIAFNDKNYRYNEINSVYYICARYNVYGDRINRGSYVILFDDQTSLDLDGSTTVARTKKEILPLLKSKGFEVKYADSEKDLPWYTVE